MKKIFSFFSTSVIHSFKSNLVKNTSMLYLLSAAQMLFPLFTFPYLTRVLSLDGYAVMAYVRAVMSYMSMWVAFGFTLSATKRIVHAEKDFHTIGHIVSDTMLARILLWLGGALILAIMCSTIPLLRQNLLFSWVSYGSVFFSCFMTDYLFRGLEKMHEITIRFVMMKSISTILTFLLIHSDKDLLRIPLLDIFSSLAALILIYFQFSKYNIHLYPPTLSNAWKYIKESFEYFLSDVSTTAFGIFNTVVIGIFLPEDDVAIWAVALQLMVVVQTCYNPIISAIYPNMVRTKRFSLIKQLLYIFMPIILLGCLCCHFLTPLIVCLVAGEKYMAAVPIFRMMIPVLIFAFPAMLCGWPSLGAIGKVRQTTLTTVISACTQCAGLGILILFGQFTLPAIAMLRNLTEFVLLGTRASFVYKYRKEFK